MITDADKANILSILKREIVTNRNTYPTDLGDKVAFYLGFSDHVGNVVANMYYRHSPKTPEDYLDLAIKAIWRECP